MKKRGATLIEIIAVLGILTIFLSIGVLGIKILKKRYEQVETKSYLYEIVNILSYGKVYCVNNNTYGNIKFINDENYLTVCLVVDINVVKSIEIRKNLKLKPFNNGEDLKKISLNINPSGYVAPTTINLINEDNEIFKITIQVGGNVIVVKEGGN